MELEEIVKKISEASALELELIWIPRIVENQTDDEKNKLCTTKKNGTGLNMADAPFVTSVYNKIKSGNHLSERQADLIRKILPKYKRQYMRMIKSVNNDIKKQEEHKQALFCEEEGTCWDDDFGEGY